MNVLGVIPARYASSRFPGKPLAIIDGKPMIQRVFEQAKKAIDHVVVATDDERIEACVKSFGGEVVLTSKNHPSGTDRCAEAVGKYLQQFKYEADVVVNIQGDEPFISPDQIEQLIACFNDSKTAIATLIKPITDQSTLFNPNKVKVVANAEGFALLFSRSPIPYLRGIDEKLWAAQKKHFSHIGMYAYRKNTLDEITKLKPGELEQLESLEQLRWLEQGISIKTAVTQEESPSIDTPEDLNNLLIKIHKQK